MAQQNTKRQ